MAPNSKWIQCVFLIALIVVISGCQSDAGSIHRSNFGEIWKTYQACRSADKTEEVIAHARTVENMVALRSPRILTADPDRLSRVALTKLVHPLKTRLAVDPQAMNADCLLHAGQVAYLQGQIILAQDMFGRVLKGAHVPELHYYVESARLGLLRIDQEFQATAEKIPPTALSN